MLTRRETFYQQVYYKKPDGINLFLFPPPSSSALTLSRVCYAWNRTQGHIQPNACKLRLVLCSEGGGRGEGSQQSKVETGTVVTFTA